VLVLVAFFAIGGSTPDGDASARKVVSFYNDNETKEIIAAVVLSLGAVVLLAFASVLRDRLREALPGRSALPGLAFAAGVVAAAGFMTAATIHFALADYATDIRPAAAQAINAIDSDFFLPFALGTVSLVLAGSLAAIRTGFLPKWLGGVGGVLFVISFTPAGFIGFGLAGIWIIVVSILLYQRSQPVAAVTGPATPD